MTEAAARPCVFLVAGEKSGDELGARLMQSLRERTSGAVDFSGVGGEAMEARGLASLFPMSDIAVMGLLPVVARLPTLLRRIRETADAIIAARPHALVIIDSPDFTHRVAKRVRARAPDIPIIDYVSPTVWAWRPGRARAMRAYVDHVMALLPFEPEAHRRLGGPECSYVGHPLVERIGDLRAPAAEAAVRDREAPVVLILPGSRRAEIEWLMPDFGAAAALVAQEAPNVEFVLPAVPHLVGMIRQRASLWPVKPSIVTGEAEKFAAFRRARAALAASGTVTLELALARVPGVVAYKVAAFEEWIARRLVITPSIVLPNLVLGEDAMPEFIGRRATPKALADALLPLVGDSAAREAQLAAFTKIEARMSLPGGAAPGDCAAARVLAMLRA